MEGVGERVSAGVGGSESGGAVHVREHTRQVVVRHLRGQSVAQMAGMRRANLAQRTTSWGLWAKFRWHEVQSAGPFARVSSWSSVSSKVKVDEGLQPGWAEASLRRLGRGRATRLPAMRRRRKR